MAQLADVVVLAAGRSSRMGEPKGLCAVEGRPWLVHQLEALTAAGLPRAIVVLGHDRDAYRSAIADLSARAAVVVNEDPDRGPFSSLQRGLAEVAPGQGAFVLPVDVPAASTVVWSLLSDALAGGAAAAVPVYEGAGGHPVLLGGPLVQALLALPAPAEARLDVELRKLGSAVARVPVGDPRVRLNLNAMQDWGKLERGG